jgi:hypothetical protein
MVNPHFSPAFYCGDGSGHVYFVALGRAPRHTEAILAKIKASPCSFDTSPEGLKQLKDAHVPDQVVIEMVKRLLNP